MYKDIENDVSIDALNSSIESDMKEHMGELTSNVSEYVKNAILDCTSDIRKRVDDIVAVYTSQGNDIKLPTLSVPKITMGSISIKPVLDKIAKELAEQLLHGVRVVRSQVQLQVRLLEVLFPSSARLLEQSLVEPLELLVVTNQLYPKKRQKTEIVTSD